VKKQEIDNFIAFLNNWDNIEKIFDLLPENYSRN